MSTKRPLAQHEYPPDFLEFWRNYPCHDGKYAALLEWRRLNPDSALLGTMLAALDRQKRSRQWTKEDGAFVPYARTWLHQRRWEDGQPQIPEWKRCWRCGEGEIMRWAHRQTPPTPESLIGAHEEDYLCAACARAAREVPDVRGAGEGDGGAGLPGGPDAGDG